MKKLQNILLFFAVLFVLAACGDGNDVSQATHFPFEENLMLLYEIQAHTPTGEFTDTFRIFNAYLHDNRMQRLIKIDGFDSIMLEIIELAEGEVRHIVGLATSQEEWLTNTDEEWFSPFVDFTESRSNTFRVIMPTDLELGATWETDPFADVALARTSEITGLDITVTVPAGTFNTVEITTTRPNHAGEYLVPPRSRAFFAPGIGMVEERNYPGIRADNPDGLNAVENVAITRLMSYSREGMVQSVLLFLPDEVGNLPQLDVNFTTNNELIDVFNDMLSRAAAQLFDYTLPADARLNRIFINPNSRNLHLDFSAAFLQSMRGQVTSEYEENRVLAAIVDTFALLYHASGVTITIDEAPYNGAFVSFNPMEFWAFGRSMENVEFPEDPIFEEFRQVAAAIHPQFMEILNYELNSDTRAQFEGVFSDFFIEDFLAGTIDRIRYWNTEYAEVTPFGADSFMLMDEYNRVTIFFTNEPDIGWRIDFMAAADEW